MANGGFLGAFFGLVVATVILGALDSTIAGEFASSIAVSPPADVDALRALQIVFSLHLDLIGLWLGVVVAYLTGSSVRM